MFISYVNTKISQKHYGKIEMNILKWFKLPTGRQKIKIKQPTKPGRMKRKENGRLMYEHVNNYIKCECSKCTV